MLRNCPYCKEEFTAKRRDKIYCSNSCKQMAFVKRQENAVGFVQIKSQPVNPKRQLPGTSIIQNVKPSTNNIDVLEIKRKEQKPESLIYEEEDDEKEKVYVSIRCKWMDDIFVQFDMRGRDSWLKVLPYDMEKRVEWVGIHYRCLLDCIITLSKIKKVEWADLAEIVNALTFLITSQYFNDLPKDYPFAQDIILVRDKLKHFCLETKSEKQVQFDLTFATKKDLLLQRYELSTVYSKISFTQLQLNFKTEADKQNEKLKQEQQAIESSKERPWRAKYRALKRQSDSEN